MRSRLLILMGIVVGLLMGLGGYTFVYARGIVPDERPGGLRQLSRHARAVRRWQRSSHRSVAVCNDCHAPHDVLGKYSTKASNGFWHSFYFTTGTFPEPIRIRPRTPRSRKTRAVPVMPPS